MGGKMIQFASVNYPTKMARHQGYRFKLTDIASDLDTQDSTFKLVRGLSGAPGSVSFELSNFPGFYLRHRAFEIWGDRNDGSALFSADASFVPRAGLAGAGLSFEAVNFPSHYIRHQGFELFLHPSDGSALFAADASFAPSGKAAKTLTKRAHPGHKGYGKASLTSHNFSHMKLRHQAYEFKITDIHSDLDKADSTFRIVPALNGAPGAVSFEATNFKGHFLRHSGFKGLLAAGDGSPLFAADASFFVRSGFAEPAKSVSFELSNFPGHFLRHRDYVLWGTPGDGSALFAADATFKPKGKGGKALLRMAKGLGPFDGDSSSSSDSSDSD